LLRPASRAILEAEGGESQVSKLSTLETVLLLVAAAAQSVRAGDWPISTPSREGLDEAGLARLDARIRSALPHVRSLMIARHGSLVFEHYYGDASPEKLHNIQSMTKSVSSALVGIALKKGLIKSLDNKVLDYYPEYRSVISDQRVREITIWHLLTMASGIDEMQLSFDKVLSNPIAEILRQRLLYLPGGGFQYSSPAAHLLGGVLRKATGRSVLDFARTELFQPLGLGRVEWYADSTGLQSGGLSGLWRSRDLLKFGELYLRQGTWRGAELISPAYIAESVTVQNRGKFYGEKAIYGFMWWITSIGRHEAFYARGYGGQYLVVIPRADLVVLCTSDWKRPEYPEHFALLGEFILPAITSNGGLHR
jgi:CubicO group peptidase (beta-lactamase class C family)